MGIQKAISLLALGALLCAGAAGCVTSEKRVVGQRTMSDEPGESTSIVHTKIKEYTKLANQFPNEAKYRERLAALHWIAEDHESALEHLAEARELDPGDAKYDLMEARIYYSIGNYGSAEERYLSLIERVGDEYDGPIYELAWLYMIDEKDALAERNFQRCLEINPKLAGAHYGLGEIMLKRNQSAQAIAHYEDYLRLGSGVHHDDVLKKLRRLQPGLYNYKP
ncbi:MAG: tetratricopeptide repeat protein [Planctomycetes bacterium]|nr:tetratricopeptide repeat protein [Planctomycetota bacterium]